MRCQPLEADDKALHLADPFVKDAVQQLMERDGKKKHFV